MKEIKVQGYTVTVEVSEGVYIVSVPELPGCTIQVDREEDGARRIEGVMGEYLKELAGRRPKEIGGPQRRRKPEDPTVKLRR
ncbi:MAG: type II toxin-antitoxin system HicB family antitoxin [Candidatus ainarchaeum sp.]|nr:type II toxin-antitoxin system HicB family antitoxin [Candidatus ainarchaeum sp.]